MSHELRTPLNSILGFSDILKDQSFGNHSDPRYLEYAGNIHDSGSHLLRIITDILDLSKIEAGKFELTEEEFELEIPFNNVQAMMARLAEDAGLTLSLECDPDLPGLRGDLRTVQQMLINLVSNSVKFTPSGGSITVTAERQDDTSGGGLVIQIADTGVGIAPENIAKVLSPFGQIEGPMRRQHQGTGLGLPLVRSFMHLHDGELSIDSNAPQGTTIDLTFPKDRLVERVAVATKKELKAEKSA
ncbi:MAG: HAMP domain-containing histidine kinase, partial [Rhodospirillaceae bacterium]|nr:HAMP domain-containing histidine kinase [Rhodospirillaceae bacterium]